MCYEILSLNHQTVLPRSQGRIGENPGNKVASMSSFCNLPAFSRVSLSLSRSVGRVVENPENEVANSENWSGTKMSETKHEKKANYTANAKEAWMDKLELD